MPPKRTCQRTSRRQRASRDASPPPMAPMRVPPSSRPTIDAAGRNVRSPVSMIPDAHATSGPRPRQIQRPESRHGQRRADQPEQCAFHDERPADVRERRADELHDFKLLAPRQQSQPHDRHDRHCGREDEDCRQGEAGAANHAHDGQQPVDPAAVVSHVAHARQGFQPRRELIDGVIAGQRGSEAHSRTTPGAGSTGIDRAALARSGNSRLNRSSACVLVT